MSDQAKEFLDDRRMSYCRTFDKDNQAAQAVLADLSRFCRANESTFDPDPRIHALLEGRKEVWLRIQHHLQMTDEELWKLYTVRK